MTRVTSLGLALAAFCLSECMAAAAPGTSFPSMKVVYTDPVTNREAWRMTTDGAKNGADNGMGDQSGESSSWSPDGTKFCYYKGGNSQKPAGIYMMDVETGVETYLAPSNVGAMPGTIFSHDGSEVYYYNGSGVCAVNITTYAARVITSMQMNIPQKITINCDGTYIAVHQWGEPKKTAVIGVRTGAFVKGWEWNSGKAGEDGSFWHPTNPAVLYAYHGTLAFWNVETGSQFGPRAGESSHGCMHPNGMWYLYAGSPGRLTEIQSGTDVLTRGGSGSPHPFINPADKDKGTKARMLYDETGSSGLLKVVTIEEFFAGQTGSSTTWVTHFCAYDDNFSHPHPQFSPDGRYILWQSDCDNVKFGVPPGGRGGKDKVDLFVAPFETGVTGTSAASAPRAWDAPLSRHQDGRRVYVHVPGSAGLPFPPEPQEARAPRLVNVLGATVGVASPVAAGGVYAAFPKQHDRQEPAQE